MTHDVDLAFSREEYARRLANFRQIMTDRGADILIIDETEHLAYLTGFGPSATMYQACIVPLAAEPIMVLRRLDEPSFFERTWISTTVSFGDAEDPVATVLDTIRQRGWARGTIGLELDSHYLTVQTYQRYLEALPEAIIVDCSRAIWELRLCKSAAEIAYLRQASFIADEAVRQAIAAVGEGVSERAAAVAASRAFLELGADSGHVGRVASGSRTNSLHGALRDHPLASGEIMHLEVVPQVSGYSARLMRPVVVGSPTAEQAASARRLIEIQDQQFAALRPGVLGRDVDAIARGAALAAGLRSTYDNSTGYTLGYYGTPHPARSSDFTRIFVPTAEWTLADGMVFHMYMNAHGMAVSETVLVTSTGHERLTRLNRQLFEC